MFQLTFNKKFITVIISKKIKFIIFKETISSKDELIRQYESKIEILSTQILEFEVKTIETMH